MVDPGPAPPWTEEETTLLRHEAFVAEVLKARWPREDRPKPRWQIVLESSVVAAIVTVILGGWVGHLLTSSIQDKIKERDLALAQQEKVTSARLEIIKQAFEVIGEVISSSEDLIELTGQEWDAERYTGTDRKRLVEQRARMRTSFNTSDAKWRKSSGALGLLLAYYSTERPEIDEAWNDAQTRVDKYIKCAQDSYIQSIARKQIRNKCDAERGEVSGALLNLTVKLHAGLGGEQDRRQESSTNSASR